MVIFTTAQNEREAYNIGIRSKRVVRICDRRKTEKNGINSPSRPSKKNTRFFSPSSLLFPSAVYAGLRPVPRS